MLLTPVCLLRPVPPDLLKNKSRPEEAAQNAAAWVVSEREMRERLKKERELKEKQAVSARTRSIIRSIPFGNSRHMNSS